MNVQKLGLLMISATLLVIGVTTMILLREYAEEGRTAARAEGLALTRILASVDYDHLLPASGRSSLLRTIEQEMGSSELAYVVLVDLSGSPVIQSAGSGVVIPAASKAAKPSLWLTEHQVEKSGSDKILEFRAPVLKQGDLFGYVRVGVFQSGAVPGVVQLPFLAMVALPIFLLAPLFYYLIRTLIKRLGLAHARLEELLAEKQPASSTAGETDNLGDVMGNLSRITQAFEQRLSEAKMVESDAVANQRVLGYQKRRSEAVLQVLPYGVIVLDEKGLANYVNGNVKTLLGITEAEVIGKPAADWCENDKARILLSRYHSNVSPLHRTQSIEFSPQNNSSKTISISAYPFSRSENSASPPATLVLVREVTADVLAKQAQDNFVLHVAHELKSPLNIIHMNAELLLDSDPNDTNETIKRVNIVHDQVQRMSKMISDLLDITQIELGSVTPDLQPLRIHDFLEDVFDANLRSADNEGIKCDLQLPHSLDNVAADKDLLRLALNNLLTNAVKYNRPGGTVTLEAEETSDSILIRVIDTGIGIPAQDCNRVFEKFYRSEDDETRARPGQGLGLTLAKQVIDVHHGRMTVESEQGVGSTFTVELRKLSTEVREAV